MMVSPASTMAPMGPSDVLRLSAELGISLPAVPADLPAVYSQGTHHLSPQCLGLTRSQRSQPFTQSVPLRSVTLCAACADRVLAQWDPSYPVAKRLVWAHALTERASTLPPTYALWRSLSDAAHGLERYPAAERYGHITQPFLAALSTLQEAVRADAPAQLARWAATDLSVGSRKKAVLPSDCYPLPSTLTTTNAHARRAAMHIAQYWRTARRSQAPLDMSALATKIGLLPTAPVMEALAQVEMSLDAQLQNWLEDTSPQVVLLRHAPEGTEDPACLLVQTFALPRQGYGILLVAPHVVARWLQERHAALGVVMVLPRQAQHTDAVLEIMATLWGSSPDGVFADPHAALLAACQV